MNDKRDNGEKTSNLGAHAYEPGQSNLDGPSEPKTLAVSEHLLTGDVSVMTDEERGAAEQTESRPDLNLTSTSKPHLLSKEAQTYEVDNYAKNAMIIFNQEVFSGGDYETRTGTDLDVKALVDTFAPLNFEIVPTENTKDCEKLQLLDELKKFSKKDFKDYGCICLVILTHGSDFGYLMAKDVRYNELEVFNCFDAQKNSSLTGKPIVVIIQACRGKTKAKGFKLELHMKDRDEVSPAFCYLPARADMLIFHSSWEGTVSVLNGEGSLFIQALCNKIKTYVPKDHLEEIFRRVRMDVALVDIDLYGRLVKQMPVVTSTLIRRLYLKKPPQAEVNSVVEDRSIESALLMPTASFSRYYEYMKKCLRSYIEQNQGVPIIDKVLLETAEDHSHGPLDMQVRAIKAICSHLQSQENAHKYPKNDFMYFHYENGDL